MSQAELERDLAYAEHLERQGYRVWHPGVTELQRAVRPKTLPKTSHSAVIPPIVPLPPASLQAAVAALVGELKKVPSGRHNLYLALAGTLLRRGLDPAFLPGFVGSIASQAADAKVKNRMSDARSASTAWQRGGRVTGYSTLRAGWPSIARVVDDHFPRTASDVENQVHAGLAKPFIEPRLSLSAAQQAVSMSLLAACEAPQLPRVLVSPPGVGKTRQAVEFALTHNGKVAIVHGTNKVSIEHFHLAELRAPGRAQRRFGALSAMDANNTTLCKKADIARVLQAGGLSVQQRLCIRCQHRSTCTARDGVEGARNGDIAFFNHAMLDAAIEHAGSNGTLVVDEGPPPFLHEVVSLEHLVTTERVLRSYQFPTSLADPCSPLLRLLLAEADTVQDGTPLGHHLHEVARSATDNDRMKLAVAKGALGVVAERELDAFDTPLPVPVPTPSGDYADDALALFLAAFAQWPNHTAPPTTASYARDLSSRLGTSSAEDVATAARTLVALKHAFADQPVRKALAYWRVADTTVALHIAYANSSLIAALRRAGPTVFLDATADERALRYLAQRPVHVERHQVVDGAATTRVVLANAKGAKRHLGPKRGAHWPVLGAALADALAQPCASASGHVLVVTHKSCAEALRSTETANVPHQRLRLALLQREAQGRRLLVAHFGDVRGRNEFDGVSWKDLDVVITIGDPWPDIGQIEAENRLLGLSPEDSQSRLRELVAAELAQAHGRLRAPRQTKPTAAIHVGSIVPAGWHSSNTSVEQPQPGRRTNVTAMTKAELLVLIGLAGSRRALAAAVGVSESTVRKYLQGRPIPLDFATRAREHTPYQGSGPATSTSSSS